MAFDTTQLVDYSWSDIAKAAKHAMMSAAMGGATYSIKDKSFGRISIKDAKALYELAIQMQVDEAVDSGGGIAIVQYGERR